MAAPKILIADSDPELIPVLALHLRNEEYEVICAGQGEAAIAAARNERPDLLVVNVGMPVGERRSIHDFLSDDPELLSIPVIYLVAERNASGASAPKLPDQSMIRKPVPTRELLHKIAVALGRPEAADADQQKYAA
ncbi:MAG: response regulator transcription factor [Planctomycetota bacterium]|jgi:two-component system response regulator VicR